ncbi:MAG: SPOR domain-containing protein [Candidatus Susulua stagnicola]|nr:SPOR domain-containing protein [Candidatus Susulua stagnicola]
MNSRQLYLFSHNKNNEKGNGRPRIILPLDTLILLGVIVILLFTLSFSMGVEKGKKVILGGEKTTKKTVNSTQIEEAATTIDKKIEKNTNIIQKLKETVEEKDRYHVQVASFKGENSALKEVKSLESNGYPVTVMKKGDYVVIYVGGFENKGEAKTNFINLKKKYKDCIFKNSL